MFHGLLSGAVDPGDLRFHTELLDVQELNQRLQNRSLENGGFAVAKASAAAAIALEQRYEILSAGAALGFGVGPLLLAAPDAPPLSSTARVWCPGALTTAHLLLRHFFPQLTNVTHTVFSEVMPALARGAADYGVVIHEGRFVYQQLGLHLQADLGSLWEERYQLPLPLGVIVASRQLDPALRSRWGELVRASVEYGYAHRAETFPTMAQYAQELAPDVIWGHVDLYVNQWSLDLGSDGQRALRQLAQLTKAHLPKIT
jgi:1,4-dihydroxy-6-naphthoate synthase